MKRKYNEIFKLKDMLERAKIPFKFSELMGGYHIVYPADGGECICSVIEHDGSYGKEKDLLEIQGLLTELEEETLEDDVLGYLTAEDVFQRLKYPQLKQGDSESSHEASLSVSSNAPVTVNARLTKPSTFSTDLKSSASLSTFIALFFRFIAAFRSLLCSVLQQGHCQ